MRDLDVGWIAGLIEGEGSFLVQTIKGRKYPRVVVWQVDREPLDRLLALVGGRIDLIQRSKTMRKDGYNRQDIYSWEIRSKTAVALVNKIYPYLSARRKQQAHAMMESVGDRFGAFLIGSE
jgi:hypothetical protein